MIRVKFLNTIDYSFLENKTKTLKNNIAKELIKNGVAIEISDNKTYQEIEKEQVEEENIPNEKQTVIIDKKIKSKTDKKNKNTKLGRPKTKK